MEPRQPQHPFSRNTGPPPPPPPYSHAPFQSAQNQVQFPPNAHTMNGNSTYPEQQQRRPSDNPYYAVPSPAYPRDAAPMPISNHARHRSTSSVGQPPQSASLPRGMPPPSSPQQHSYHNSNPFPPPHKNRAQQPPLGAYQGGRDLPALPSVNRPGSVNSSMSISSMLGGPTPTTRESAPPQSQYSTTASMNAPNVIPHFPQPVQPSPQLSSNTTPGYDRFRRPQTPESHHRREPLVVRDHRSNSAGSPPRGILSTPEQHRFGTPQTHTTRYTTGPAGMMPEERRDQYFNRIPNPNNIPPRPSSQPVTYPGPPPPTEMSRMANDTNRHEATFARANDYEQRRRIEEDMLREEERRRREFQQRSEGPPHNIYSSDPRESVTWNRRIDNPHDAVPPQPQNGYDYSRPTYAAPGREYGQQEGRYPSTTFGQSMPIAQATGLPFGSPQQDRRTQPQPVMYREGLAAMAMATAYRPHGSPNRSIEETQQPRHLGVQPDINRKSQNSPLPQAVQGAQSQLSGPASEPGIKNEFGKMFSGIGSGVGSMGPQAGTPAPASGPLRPDLENIVAQELVNEALPKRTTSRVGAGSRRRKLRDEDKVDGDDSSAGRRTPSGSGRKRVKTTAHGSSRQSAAHKYDVSPPPEPAQKASQIQPVQHQTAPHSHASVSGPHIYEHKTGVPHHHHVGVHHHHHHHVVVPSKPAYVNIPKPRQVVRSHKVIDAVLHLPRKHLGHMLYESAILPEDNPGASAYHTNRGYRSKSAPLPDFTGKENCTFTIRVPRIHLEDEARQEITSNRPLWGTDVYSDDSDVIAAAIHSGWIKGAWTADFDANLLDGSEDEVRQNGANSVEADQLFEEPPLLGPITPPLHHDVHLTILILPTLERYASTVRHGIKSRDFGAPGTAIHDGLSFLIMSMKFVKGVDTSDEAYGSSRRARMKLTLNPRSEETDEMRDEALKKAFSFSGNTITNEDAFTANLSNDSCLRQSYYDRRNTPPSASHNPLLANKTALEIQAAELLCGLGGGGWWNGRPQLDVITPPQEESSGRKFPCQTTNAGIGGEAGRNIDLLLSGAASAAVRNGNSRSISNGLEGLSEAAEAAEAAVAMEEMGSGGRHSGGSGNGASSIKGLAVS